MTFVVDCSVVIRLLSSIKGDDLLRRRLARRVHAPALIDAEISSVIRSFAITSKPEVRISPERAEEMLADYADLPIMRHPMRPHLNRIFELRHNLTAYDACYVALAEALGVPLLTDDAKFAKAAGHRAEIQPYPG